MSFSFSSSSSSSTSLLLILLLIFAIICNATFSQNHGNCSNDFWRIIKNNEKIKNCKKLRTLGVEFGWNLIKCTNNSTISVDVTFGSRVEPPAWIAWGVNPGKQPEMIGTKAIIGIIPNSHDNSGMKVRSYDITKETRMGCHLEPSKNLEGVKVWKQSIEFDRESGLYTISARLLLNSSLYNASRLNHVWQVGYMLNPENNPQGHPITLRNVDSTETLNLTSGSSTGQNRALLRKVHGVLNIVGWGTLLPIGVIVARYFRVHPYQCDKWWMYLHVVCQSAGYLIGTTGWAIGLWLGHGSKYYSFQNHRIFAIFIFTFTTIQMLALRLRPSQKDEYRKYWNMYHHFLGYGLLVIIIMNIFKGIHILQAGNGWKWAYIGILTILGAIVLGLEIVTWAKFCYDKQKQKETFKVNDDDRKKNNDQ